MLNLRADVCLGMPGVTQVLVTLDHLERVSTFQEFVQIFSQFGNEMVEFAHLTGDRQNVSGITVASLPTPPSSEVRKDKYWASWL